MLTLRAQQKRRTEHADWQLETEKLGQSGQFALLVRLPFMRYLRSRHTYYSQRRPRQALSRPREQRIV
jgi:hypothetical protein